MGVRTTDVYVIETDHAVKVGITRMGTDDRLRELRRAGGFPDARLIRSWPMTYRKAREVEAAAHWRLADTRTQGEWFHCHPFEACDAVERSIRHGGAPLESKFTAEETANIRKYLESRRASVMHEVDTPIRVPRVQAIPVATVTSRKLIPESGATAAVSESATTKRSYSTVKRCRSDAQKTTKDAT